MTHTIHSLRESVLASRGGSYGSWPWTRKLLDAADAQFGGAWLETTITGAAAMDILLPPHAGEPCKGDLVTLVGDHGASVRDVASALAKMAAAYEKHNASCWERMSFAFDAPFSAVVLCRAPLDAAEYKQVAPRPGALYCIDGFHRLVGWAYRARLTNDAVVPAWIAG